MKTIVSIALFTLLSSTSWAQLGTISSITTIPANPTDNDPIQLVGDFTLSYSSCEKDYFTASVVGNQVVASAQYCIGMLAAICYATDTVNLGTLPAGTYTVVLTLNVGSGPTPCTPGIVPEDVDTVTFTVAPTSTGIEESYSFLEYSLVPNPAQDYFYIQSDDWGKLAGETLSIYSYDGRLVSTEQIIQNGTISTSSLANGLYYISIGEDRKARRVKKLVVSR